jgi:hypothetical protein
MAARTGMANLIATLRGMTDAGTADYTISTVTYWSDEHLQAILDKCRTDLVQIRAVPVPVSSSGALVYLDYWVGYENLEESTAFSVMDGVGTPIVSGWTADYARGIITFATDHAGQSVLVSAHSYNLNTAAAETWRRKAAQAAKLFDFSTDNHKVSRGQYVKNCMDMVRLYAQMSGPVSTLMERQDTAIPFEHEGRHDVD